MSKHSCPGRRFSEQQAPHCLLAAPFWEPAVLHPLLSALSHPRQWRFPGTVGLGEYFVH